MSQIASGAEVGIAKTKTLAGLSLKVFLQPPYQRLPWHTHRDASICFVVSGSYTERFGSAVRECTPHSMVFKPAVERHTDQFGRLGGTCLLVEIPAHRLSMLEPVARVTAQPTLVRSAKLAALGHDLYGEVVHEDALSSFAVEGLVLEILAEASRRRSASAGPPPGPPGYGKRTISFTRPSWSRSRWRRWHEWSASTPRTSQEHSERTTVAQSARTSGGSASSAHARSSPTPMPPSPRSRSAPDSSIRVTSRGSSKRRPVRRRRSSA